MRVERRECRRTHKQLLLLTKSTLQLGGKREVEGVLFSILFVLLERDNRVKLSKGTPLGVFFSLFFSLSPDTPLLFI